MVRGAWNCLVHPSAAPSLDVAILRDSQRNGWHAGSDRVSDLYAKFTGTIFGHEAFIDSTNDTPEETMLRVLSGSA